MRRRALFIRAMTFGEAPVEITTDRAPAYPRVIDQRMTADGGVCAA
jgi:hypothetical protein